MKLDRNDFLAVIDATPLVSIDIIVRDFQGRILMGRRANAPALNSWFVPGGRIRKGERIADALARISMDELGIVLKREDGRLIGVFDHCYETNFANFEGIHTQYVVIALAFDRHLALDMLPLNQHSEWNWFNEARAGDVHENSAAYFRAVRED